jgi:hypothetical protein
LSTIYKKQLTCFKSSIPMIFTGLSQRCHSVGGK